MKTPNDAPRRGKKRPGSPLAVLLIVLTAAALGLMLFIRYRDLAAAPSADPKAPSESVLPAGSPEAAPAGAETLDFRDQALSFEDYTGLCGQYPGRTVRWMVPLSGGAEDSASERLLLKRFEPDDLRLLPCFASLTEIDARGVPLDPADAARIRETVPGARLLWMVPVGTELVDSSSSVLRLPEQALSVDALTALLAQFDRLETVTAADTAYLPREQAAIREQFPSVLFDWDVAVCGQRISSLAETITLSELTEEQLRELEESAGAFCQVRELTLTQTVLSPAQAASLRRAFGDAALHASLSLFGREFSCEAEEIDLSGIPVDDVSVFDDVIAVMPQLRKVEMCDCGVPDEEMDALNHRYEGVRFIWTIHMAIYSLRTDATYFCASDLPYRNNIGLSLTDEQLAPIKYCTDLVALDLGHMQYTDISFLENMPHLRYLIMVTCKYTDISPIGTLHELYYLEIFHNHLDDLTPLLSCESLRYLNIGYSEGFDTAPLYQMRQLERLWFPGNTLTEEEKAALQRALPDTECYLPTYDWDGSTGGGWRESEAYREMRDALHMYYMPGGTGMHET